MKTTTINQADRDFYEKVSRAAFANPFSDRRTDLDLLIAGSPANRDPARVLETAIATVAERVSHLRQEGKAELRCFASSDQEIMRTVFLFAVFHRHLGDFDRLIQTQIKAGDTPSPAPFARDALAELCRFGLSDGEAGRYFALFYQLRRAYFFITNGLVGKSPAMRTLRMHLWNSVFTHNIRWYETHLWNRMEEFSTLLLGETGTGKGAAAAAIGRSGFIPFDDRKGCFAESFTRNFIALNLSQFSEGVLESELFGHRKGAFTGAIDNHDGIFSRCTPHGSIFLDEIGDVNLQVQTKLLQVLQERTFTPVGSHSRLRFQGRVIAATNRSLTELRQSGQFRDDFYYRLCSNVIEIPPLRQRLQEFPGELDELIGSILGRMTTGVQPKEVQLLRKALERDLGTDYPWPGNVRELEQAVRRVLITGHYQGETRDLPRGLEEALKQEIADGTIDAQSLLAGYCRLLYQRHNTFEEVARRTKLDRRTVKKYITAEED